MDTPNTPGLLSPADLPNPSSFDGGTSLSGSEGATMAGWAKEDLAAGKITQARYDQILDQLGVPAEQRGLQPDERSAEQVQLDESFPPAKGEQYAIRYGIPGQEAPMTPELKQFDTKARGWMVDSGLPVSLGNSLVNTIGKVVETTGKMSEAQLQHYGETEFANYRMRINQRSIASCNQRRGWWMHSTRRHQGSKISS